MQLGRSKRGKANPGDGVVAAPVPRQGVIRGLASVAVVAIAAAIAAVVAVMALSNADLAAADRARLERATSNLAADVSERVALRRDTLASLAEQPELAARLAATDRDGLGELARTYRAAFPQARRLLIVPAGGLQARPRGEPPIGYALVDLVNARIRDGGTAVEVHRPGQPDAQFNVVAGVTRDGEGVGALVVSYPVGVLTDGLAGPHGAPWALVQDAGGARATVAHEGGTPGGQRTLTGAVAGTPWRVEVGVGTPSGPLSAARWPALASAAGGAATVIALVGVLVGRRVRAAIGHDGAQLTSLVGDLAAGRVAPRYATATRELAAAFDAAVGLARGAGAPPAASVSAATSAEADTPEDGQQARAAPSPERPAPEPDWASGLEVTEIPDEPESESEPAREPKTTETADTAAHPADVPLAFDEEASMSTDTGGTVAAIDPSILRAYDIRGVVGRTLTPESLRALGQAIGSEAAARGQTRVVVGYDGRHSSPELAAALADGLTRAGREVIDIGLAPTPLVYFAAHHLGTHAGVAVTGSHNPPEYNGLKIVVGGETLWGDAIQDLGRRIAERDLISGEGEITQREVVTDYIDRIAQDVALHRAQRVVIDCGNGVAGDVAPTLFRALGCEVEELFCEVDGDFPNHHPDPTVPENLATLIDRVRASGADLGIAFDGDGDRLGIVDDAGKIIYADRQMMLFAADVLSRNPGADIVFDVKCTSRLAEVITENAGVPVMWKTGHSLIKQKLRDTGAPLAGEMSGHFFFSERWYGFDDGLYAGARLLELLSMDSRPASAIFAELPEGVSTPELRVDLDEGDAPVIVEKLLADSAELEAARVSTIDGLRVDFPDGWGLVRASNTQPCLVLRFEGNDDAALERVQAIFRDRLQAAKPGIALPF